MGRRLHGEGAALLALRVLAVPFVCLSCRHPSGASIQYLSHLQLKCTTLFICHSAQTCWPTRRQSHAMLAVALVVQGLVTPAIVTTATPLATAIALRVAVAKPPLAPVHRSVHRSRCRSVRLQTEDDEASDGDSESPRRSAVLFRRLSDVLFLLTSIAIQAIGAASVVGGPARCKGQARPPACKAGRAGQPEYLCPLAEAGGRPRLGLALARVAGG
jgi:hypothetical protein